ncbi:putative Helix-turn-helix transcriptional regulator [Candidatus Magnetomoraceae bacterium gMMP-15]
MLKHTKKHRISSDGQVIFNIADKEYIFYGTSDQLHQAFDIISKIGLKKDADSIPWRQTEIYNDMIEKHKSEGAAYLAGCRIKHEMTQAVLAAKMNITRQYISEMERGKRSIEKDMAKKLSKIFKCDYKRFL